MNRIYRSIWNDRTGTFVAVPETARGAGKKSSPGATAVASGARFTLKALTISLMLSFGSNVYALPVGGVVTAGGASIGSSPGSTTITQSSQNVAINWQSFNIGQGEAVQFVQPNSHSVALNRVLSSDPSSILGSLSANGNVFLLNPNGILFGQGAQVNVGGLVASTLNISDGDFMAGNYTFSGAGNGAILNQGSINADGGYVALLGANVSNQGVIVAKLGTVALAAGDAITLDVAGDGLLNVTVDQGAVNTLVQNGGLIQADGGHVLLTAMAAGSLLQSAVNNTGVIQARSIENHNGIIRLMGDMQTGTTNVGGTLDASAPNGGDGGFIETSAAHVKIAEGTIINAQSAQGKAGTWLIDPFDFTIATIGGDMTPTDLASALAANVIISSNDGLVSGVGGNGDINVNDDVTWSTATTLTLNAVRNVNLNANITATTGTLVLDAGTDVIVNAMPGTGITTTDGSITWSAGNDIIVNAGVVGGVTATRGNITWVAGNDVTIESAVTVTDGDFSVCCGRDINVAAAVTTTRGDVLLNAGRDISITAVMTTTDGHVVLRAGSEPSAAVPGRIGGTVFFGPGILYTVSGATPAVTDVKIYYTPDTYNTPHDYSGNFTGNASTYLTQYMLVFMQGNDKTYDGLTTTTLTFRGDPTFGGVNDISLVPGTADFDTKDVGTDKTITYSGYSLDGGDAAQFSLWAACNVAAGSGVTSASITPADYTILSDSKLYDGNANFSDVALTGIAGENFTVAGAVSNSKDVATASSFISTSGAITGLLGADTGNYNALVLGDLITNSASITPALLVIVADTQNKTYGAADPNLSYVAGVFQLGDTAGTVLSGTLDRAAGETVAGGPYAITQGSLLANSNYSLVYTGAVLSIDPAPLTVTANDASKVYGSTLAPFAGTEFAYTSTQNGETVDFVGLVSVAGPVERSPVRVYVDDITPSNATGGNGFIASNYDITYVSGDLTITPLTLTGSITAADKVYDANNSATILTRTLDGVVAGDVVNYVGGTATFDTPAVGVDKTVTGTGLGLDGADSGNYTVNSIALTTADITPIPPNAPPSRSTQWSAQWNVGHLHAASNADLGAGRDAGRRARRNAYRRAGRDTG